MKKRFLSLLLCLALVICAVPGIVFAAGNATAVSIDNITLDSTAPYLVQGANDPSTTAPVTNGYAYFDASTGTLTLNNYTRNITTSEVHGITASSGSLIINLVGENAITVDAPSTSGIQLDSADLTFLGDGSLNISASQGYTPIQVGGTLTFGSASLATDFTGTVTVSTNSSHAFSAIQCTSLAMYSGNVTATHSGSSGKGIGVTGNSLTVNGGVLTANGTQNGIYQDNNYAKFIVNNGTVNANVTGANATAFIFAGNLADGDRFVIADTATVTATATGANSKACNLKPKVNGTHSDATITPNWSTDPTVYVDIWVNDININSNTAANVLGDGTVKYDAATNTLTLNGCNFSGRNQFLHTKKDLTIHLKGSNTVASTTNKNSILVEGANLCFTGDGSLTVTKTSGWNPIEVTQKTGDANTGIITFGSASDKNAFTGTVNVTNNGSGAAEAIKGYGMFVYNGKVEVKQTAGAYALRVDGDLTVSGGELTVTNTNTRSYGIYLGGTSACTMTVSGGETVISANGVAVAFKSSATNNITATGVTVIASTNADGSEPVTYEPANLNTYKYLQIGNTPAPAPTYAVTVAGGTADKEQYAEGDTVTITADTSDTNKIFKEWSISPDSIALADKTQVTTTFTMPAQAVTVEAMYEDIPTVTGVALDPTTVTVKKGESQTFTVTVTGTGDISTDALWSLTGNTSADTKLTVSPAALRSSAVMGTTVTLTVGADETAATLTVTAIAVQDENKAATATVTVTEAVTPGNPGTPGTPGTPVTPNTPDDAGSTPGTPGGINQTAGSTTVPDTADNSMMGLYSSLLLAACVGLAVLYGKRKKRIGPLMYKPR